VRPRPLVAKSGTAPDRPVPGCYAATLGDCGGGISSEHFISEGLLELLASRSDGRGIFARGPAWREGKWLPLKALGSNILCCRHNEALSVFDGAMALLGRRMLRLGEELNAQDPTPWLFAIHGRDVERWLLKVLCGVVAGGHAARASGEPVAREVPDRWVRILFGLEEMPPSWGLYVEGAVGRQLRLGVTAINVRPISVKGSSAGVEADVFGWKLVLSTMLVQPDLARGAISPDSLYRPALLQIPTPAGAKQIYFHWEPGDMDGPLLDYGPVSFIVCP
jgi:hypothetical protein